MAKPLPRWRYRPQAYAVTAGGVIFISAGMNMTLSLGWSQCVVDLVTKHLIYSWFIGVLIGTAISVQFSQILRSRLQIVISAVLIFVAGILMATDTGTYAALLAARYMNGIAVGLNGVTFLMHAGEVASDGNRGNCLGMEQFYISLGVAVQMVHACLGNMRDFSTCRLHGMIDALVALLAIISLVNFVESPIYTMRRGNVSETVGSIAALLRPNDTPEETAERFQQCQTYVREQMDVSMGRSISYAMVPLLKMLIFRCMVLSFCFSRPLNEVLNVEITEDEGAWVPGAAGGCRLLGALVALFVMNHVARRLVSLTCMAIIGGLLISFAAAVNVADSQMNLYSMDSAKYIYMLTQFFLGIFAPFTSVYTGEAFPLQVKSVFLAFCIIAQQLIQIALIQIDLFQFIKYNGLMYQGCLIMASFVILAPILPETRGVSFSEAQRRLRKWMHIPFRL